MITVIIPYKAGQPIYNPPKGDETLWIDEGLGIGEARIEGARRARYDWLIMADADGDYPADYVDRVRKTIISGRYPLGFRTTRRGGFTRVGVESGIVVRKDVLLERTEGFVPDHRKDIMYIPHIFDDLPLVEDIRYVHGLTKDEKNQLLAAGVLFALVL